MGLKAYAAIGDLPEKIDFVYIVLPSQHMETAIQQCVDAGARAACIITAGFSEAGPIGKVIQDKNPRHSEAVRHAARGPNTIGMVNTECGMMGSFVNFPRWENGEYRYLRKPGSSPARSCARSWIPKLSGCRL